MNWNKKMKATIFAMPVLGIGLVILALGPLTGCSELGELVQPNKAPIIDRVFAWRTQLSPTDTTTVMVEAHDPEGKSLSYEWEVEGGTLSSTSGSRVTWSAPAVAKNYKISVKVSDEKEEESEGSVTVTVVAVERPTVNITRPPEGAFIPGLGTTTLEAVASHPNGIARVDFYLGTQLLDRDDSPPYRYEWSIEGLSGPATIIASAFRAGTPGAPGMDSVRVSIEGVTRP